MRRDWIKVSLYKDLNYVKTGVSEYEGYKKYYSTGSIKNQEHISEGSYKYTDKPSRANRVVKTYDVLQARMKGTNKAVIINNKLNEQLFSTGFFQVRTHNINMSKFIYYYFSSLKFLNEKDSYCTGSTQSAINDNSIKNIYIELPPLLEQKAIVSKIEQLFSELDNGIENLKTAQKKLKIYRQAVLKKAFEGELTKEWREKQTNLPTASELLEKIKKEREEYYLKQIEEWKESVKEWEANGKDGKKPKKPQPYKPMIDDTVNILMDTNLPNKWKYNKLGETYEVYIGSTPSRKMNSYWNGKINWVSSGEVAFKNIRHTKETITKDGLDNTSTNVHPIGTILLAMIGEGKTRGQTAILDIPAAHNQNTAALRVNHKLLESKLLYYYFYYTYHETRRIGSGNNQKALNKNRISNMSMPLMSKEEQIQIVQEIESRLSVCDNIEVTITDNLQKSEALRQSILKKAFEGKLLTEKELEEIKNNPEYESAEKLLERIKQERDK